MVDIRHDVMSSADHLFGRDDEIRRIRLALDATVAGRGGVVLVAGEGGIGKTTLLAALAADAAAVGAIVAWGRGDASGDAPDLWPWLEVVHELVRQSPEAAACRRMPPADEVFDAVASGAPSDDALPARFRVLEAVTTVVRAAAASRPVVVVLDDLHLADELTVRAFRHLADRLADRPLLLAAACRHEELADSLDRQLQTAAARGQHLVLRGLDRTATGQLASRTVGRPLSTSVVDSLQDMTGGVPVLVQQAASQYRVGEQFAPEPTAGARAIVAARLAALSPPGRALLEGAALHAGRGSLPVLAAAAGIEDLDEAYRARAELLERGLLDGGDDGRACVSLGLVAETIRVLVPADRARAMHLRMADALARDPAASSGERARHLRAALPSADPREVVDALVTAGTDARRRLGYEAAADFLQDAVALLRDLPDASRELLAVLLDLGDVQMRCAQPTRGAATFSEAQELAAGLDDVVGQARAVVGRGRSWMRAAGFDLDAAALIPELERVLDRVVAVADESPDLGAIRARLQAIVVLVKALGGEHDGLRPAAEDAVRVARRATDPGAVSLAAVAERWVLVGPVSPEDRAAATAALVAAADRADDPEQRWYAARWELMDALERGQLGPAMAAIEESSRLADSMNEPYFVAMSTVWRATLALLQGRYDAFEELARRAGGTVVSTDVGGTWAIAGQYLWLARDRGTLDPAALDFHLAQAPDHFVIRVLRGWVAAHAGDGPVARAVMDEFPPAAIAALPRSGYWVSALTMLADVCAVVRDPAAAAALAAALERVPDVCVVTGGGPIVWAGPVAHYLGLVRHVSGDVDGAIEAFEAAADVCRRLGARPMLARVDRAWAAALVDRGTPEDRELGRRHARDAEVIADALGLVLPPEGELGVPPVRGVSPETSVAVLRRRGDGWEVGLDRERAHVRPVKGLAFLRLLLERPGVEVLAVELEAAGTRPRPGNGTPRDGPSALEGDLGPVIDARAVRAYRARLAEIDDRLGQDLPVAAEARTLLEEERDALVQQLAAGLGVGGRLRRTGSPAERARVNVTRTIRAAIRRVGEVLPDLGAHLDSAVRTGRYCVYDPDPTARLVWRLDDDG